MAASGAAVAYCAAGGLILYSGIKGSSLSDTAKAVLKGNLSISDTQPVDFSSGSAGVSPAGGSGAVASGDAAKAQAYAKSQMSRYGWNTTSDFDDLVKLWDRESGWSNTADTRVTHAGGDGPGSKVFAYGIAQARPATKYPLAGQPPDLGGKADAETQVDWGMQYIHSAYQGSVAMAWGHEQQNGWY
jgi:hypothetical protein